MMTDLPASPYAALTPFLLVVMKSSAVLLIAFVVTSLMQRASATSRHLVWVASLLATLAIPVLAAWSPIRFAVLPASWSTAPGASPTAQRSAMLGAAVATDRAPSAIVPSSAPAAHDESVRDLRQGAGDAGAAPPMPSARPYTAERISPVNALFIVWGTVLCAILGWLAYGAFSVRRIVRGATPLEGAEWQGPMIDMADRFELTGMPRLLRADGVTMPFACGVRTPTIVLPAECDSWTTERRTAVLLHELAHIRRRDIIGHTMGRIVCALYWFNPLAWMAAKRLRAESERACDDMALGCGTRASDYAEHLLDIVTSARKHGTPSVAMAMATRSEFEGRMLAILDPSLMRAAPTRVQASTLSGGVMMFAIVAGSAVPRAAAAPGQQLGASEVALADSRGIAPRPSPSGRQNAMPALDTAGHGKRTEPSPTGMPGPSESSEAPESIDYSKPIASPADPEPAASPAPVPQIMPFETARAMLRQRSNRGNPETGEDRADSSIRAGVFARILRSDTAASLRRTAAWALNEFAEQDVAIDALVHAARRDASAEVREMAAWALSDANADGRAVSALAVAMRDDRDHNVRESAAWSLGGNARRDDTASIAALVGGLDDATTDVREMSAWALGNARPRRAPAALVAALGDRSEQVRGTVAWALFQIADRESANAIDAALQRETDADAKWALIRAIAVMGDRAIEPLQRMIESKDAPLRALAIRALAGGGSYPWPQPRPRPRPFP